MRGWRVEKDTGHQGWRTRKVIGKESDRALHAEDYDGYRMKQVRCRDAIPC